MLKQVIMVAFALLFIMGCESKPEEQAADPAPPSTAPLETATLLQEPVKTVLVETATEALPRWRESAPSRPALLLLSKNSQLQSIPEAIRDRAVETAQQASIEEIKQKTLLSSVDPVLLPNMALSAALEAGFFSEVIWILPVAPGKTVTLDSFLRKQLELGDITQEEADSFRGSEKSFVGTIHKIPFTVTLLEHIPKINQPVILHFDVGFLGESYKNEVNTPLYRHTYDTLKLLGRLNLQAVAVSIAQSNLTDEVSLRTRFLGPLIANLFENPEQLNVPLTGNDRLRNEALYLGNFFKKEEVLALHRKMVMDVPNDASAHYDLFQTLRQFKHTEETFAELALAVQLDPVYAKEYLDMADLALNSGQPLDALGMLEKAARSFPNNRAIDIGIAELLIATGQTERARTVIEELSALPWSDTYHGQVNERFEKMLEWADRQDTVHAKEKARPSS